MRYLTFPPEIETAMREMGAPPGEQGYDIRGNDWSEVFMAVAFSGKVPLSAIKQAQAQMDASHAYLRQMMEFRRAVRVLLEMFPLASLSKIKQEEPMDVLRILGYDFPLLEEAAQKSLPPSTPVTAELSLASYYTGAGYVSSVMDSNGARLKYVEEKLPSIWAQLNPRRYQVPEGYGQPKHLALIAAAAQISAVTGYSQAESSTHAAGPVAYLALARLGEMAVPTYFVGVEMTEALLRTDLPEKFTMEDLRWPLPALHICLPRDLLTDPQGRSFTNLIVARVEANKTYQLVPGGKDPGVIAPADAIVTVAYSPDAVGAAVWHHALNDDPLTIGAIDRYLLPGHSYENEDEKLADQEFGNTCRRLALQVMLAMIARPEMIEAETLSRPPKIKRGQEIVAGLWNPNFLGRTYRAKFQGEAEPSEGKKRTHWRRGHFRNYSIARGFREDKVIWIEPMLVNAPE